MIIINGYISKEELSKFVDSLKEDTELALEINLEPGEGKIRIIVRD